MKRLAEWHATQAGGLKLSDVWQMAIQFAGYDIPRTHVKGLLSREDWWQYREELALDEQKRVRRKIEQTLEEYVDTHYWALQAAKQAGDYGVAAKIAEGAIDRVWPKREEQTNRNQTIIINNTVPMQPAHHLEPLPIEVEAIEVQDSPGGQSGQ